MRHAPQGEGDRRMQAIVRDRYGGADVVRVEEIERPSPGPTEIRIGMRAVSLNGSDWEGLRGRPGYVRVANGFRRPRNRQLGSDIAGVVESVGESVTRFAVGDAVFGDLLYAAPRTLAEFVVVDESAPLTQIPDGLSDLDAACLPQAGILAHQALTDVRPVGERDRVLVVGGGGGAGTLTIQLACHVGATVDAVDRGGKLEGMRTLGAERVFDFTTAELPHVSHRYDRIIDFVGRRPLRAHRRVLTDDGVYLMVGGSGFRLIQTLIAGGVTTASSNRTMKVLAAKVDEKRLLGIADLVTSGAMQPVVDSTYRLDRAVAAFERLGSGIALGKVVVTA